MEEEGSKKTTTAKLRISTIARIKPLLGKKSVEKKESMDDFINRMLDFYERSSVEINPMPAEAYTK